MLHLDGWFRRLLAARSVADGNNRLHRIHYHDWRKVSTVPSTSAGVCSRMEDRGGVFCASLVKFRDADVCNGDGVITRRFKESVESIKGGGGAIADGGYL